jgi:hypothetical protein
MRGSIDNVKLEENSEKKERMRPLNKEFPLRMSKTVLMLPRRQKMSLCT